MNVGFYQSVSAMRALQAQQEVISSNLARQGVSGHREAIPTLVSVQPTLRQNVVPNPGQTLPQPSTLEVHTANRFTQGALERTGSATHLAVQGDAFFRVRLPDGSDALTRNGGFSRRTDGTLATPEGALLLNDGGEPVVVENTGAFSVAPDGMIRIEGADAGLIGLARIANPGASLSELSPGYFTPQNPADLLPGAGPRDSVVQFTLERSNAQPVEQMISLTTVMRAYEANQRAISLQDEATGRLVRAAGPSGI